MEEELDQEVVILLQEELVKTFPEIGADILWEVLTSYECSEVGLQKAIEKVMEISGNEVFDIDEENDNQDETTIEKFDRENNFKPNNGFGIMNMASELWNNITNRMKKPTTSSGYFKVDDDELNLEMQETKKDL